MLKGYHPTHLSHVALHPTVDEDRARTAKGRVTILGAQRAEGRQDVKAPSRGRNRRIKVATPPLAATGRGSDSEAAEVLNTIARWDQQRTVMEAQIRSKDALIRRQTLYIEELKRIRGELERQLSVANERLARPTRRTRRFRA
jgi:hypothetical protein